MTKKLSTKLRGKSFITIHLVRRCIQKFLDLSQLKRFQLLGLFHLNLINDQAYFVNNAPVADTSQKGLCQRLKQISLFRPSNTYLLILQRIYYLMLMISIVFYPIRVCFGASLYPQLLLVRYFIIGFGVLHILAKINTGVYKDGRYIYQRQLIF